jgi:hypothetical protein
MQGDGRWFESNLIFKRLIECSHSTIPAAGTTGHACMIVLTSRRNLLGDRGVKPKVDESPGGIQSLAGHQRPPLSHRFLGG